MHTCKQIADAAQRIGEITDALLPFAQARQLAKLGVWLGAEMAIIGEYERKLAAQYRAELSGDSMHFPDPQDAEAFLKARCEMLASECGTTDAPAVCLAGRLDAVTLSAAAYDALEPFIDFGGD